MVLDNVINETADHNGENGVILSGHSTVLKHRVSCGMRRVVAEGVGAYRFEVAYRGESATCTVACGRVRAREIFFALLRGRVTPCSLVYVMHELADEADIIDSTVAKNIILC